MTACIRMKLCTSRMETRLIPEEDARWTGCRCRAASRQGGLLLERQRWLPARDSVWVWYKGELSLAFFQATADGYAGYVPGNASYVGGGHIQSINPPKVIRGGYNHPSTNLGALNGVGSSDDPDVVLSQSSGAFQQGPLWSNASKDRQDRLTYVVQKIQANQGCLDWFNAHSEAIGHGANLTKLLQNTGLNFYLAGDKDRVSLKGLEGLHTNKFGWNEGFGETLFGGSANPQIVINRSVLDNKNDPELAVQLIHELFHAAGFHQGSDPKLPGIFGTPNDLNPEVKWPDIQKNCRIQ